jgi:hypothetical protein
MRPLLFKAVIWWIAGSGVFGTVQAQDALRLMDGMRQAYQQLHYTEVEVLAGQVLSNHPLFNAAQLTEAHQLLALVKYAQNDLEASRRQFEAALSLTPDLVLDQQLVSPKILEFFAQVKEAYQPLDLSATPVTDSPTIRYVRVEDVRAAAAMRSLILPGWGQYYKGEKTRGVVLMGVWGAAAVGTALASLRADRARQAYLDEPDPDRASNQRYDTWNTWFKVRNNLLLGTVGIWAYSYVDALVQRRPGAGASLRATVTPSSIQVRLHF